MSSQRLITTHKAFGRWAIGSSMLLLAGLVSSPQVQAEEWRPQPPATGYQSYGRGGSPKQGRGRLDEQVQRLLKDTQANQEQRQAILAHTDQARAEIQRLSEQHRALREQLRKADPMASNFLKTVAQDAQTLADITRSYEIAKARLKRAIFAELTEAQRQQAMASQRSYRHERGGPGGGRRGGSGDGPSGGPRGYR